MTAIKPRTFFSWEVKATGMEAFHLLDGSTKALIIYGATIQGDILGLGFPPAKPFGNKDFLLETLRPVSERLYSYCHNNEHKIRLNPKGSRAISDQELVEQIKSGQKELYADLIRQYHKKVIGYCLSMLQNHTEAEEAAQDIFIKAYRNLPKFKGNSAFSTWLYRITTNHCLDVLRKRNRRKTYSLDALVEEEGNQIHRLFSSAPVAASQMENRDLAGKILSTLPEDYRTILTLREADGLEYQEIAETMDCSLDAVKGRLSRARKQLQENLRHFLRENDVYKEE